MSPPAPHLVSRRSVVALGVTLALPWGCAVATRSIRDVNLDTIGPDQVLLLGRIHLTILGADRTGDAFVQTNAGADDMLLPPEGEVAWLFRRPAGVDLRIHRISSAGSVLTLGKGPVLAPGAVRTAISYFGTVKVTLDQGLNNNRSNGRTGQLELEIVDDRILSMAAFVAQNPGLAGRSYYHVLRGTVLEAPRPRG